MQLAGTIPDIIYNDGRSRLVSLADHSTIASDEGVDNDSEGSDNDSVVAASDIHDALTDVDGTGHLLGHDTHLGPLQPVLQSAPPQKSHPTNSASWRKCRLTTEFIESL